VQALREWKLEPPCAGRRIERRDNADFIVWVIRINEMTQDAALRATTLALSARQWEVELPG